MIQRCAANQQRVRARVHDVGCSSPDPASSPWPGALVAFAATGISLGIWALAIYVIGF